MWGLALFTAAMAIGPIPKPSGKNSMVHNVIHHGESIQEPKDCVEEEIRKRTVKVLTSDGKTCTGFLLDNQSVSTAGHCVGKVGASRKIQKGRGAMTGVAAVLYYDPKAKRYRAAEEISGTSSQLVDSQFNTKDLAVVRIKPLPFELKEARRVSGAETSTPGDSYVAGFGKDENGDSGKLKYFKGFSMTLPQGPMATTGANKQDRADYGDSGGPIVRANGCELELIGVTGSGIKSGDSHLLYGQPASDIEDHLEELNQALEKSGPGKKSSGKKGARK